MKTINFSNNTKCRLTAQFDKNNTTLENIPELFAEVESGKTYELRAKLFCLADETGGFKLALTGSATKTHLQYEVEVKNFGTSEIQVSGSGSLNVVKSGEDIADMSITIEGLITVNAGGTLGIKFAQKNESGVSSVLLGSTFEINELL